MKILSIILLLILSSCFTNKKIIDTSISEIVFGNGGGFTGEIIAYKLTIQGEVFYKGKQVNKIDKKSTLEIFKQAKELNNLKYNEPENTYSFIEILSNDYKNKIVWNTNSNVDEKIIKLYTNLISTTKTNSHVK